MTLVPSHWERGQIKRDTAMVAGAFSGLEGASTKTNAEPWLPPTPSHWRVVQLGFVSETVAGYAFPSDGFSADEDHVRLLRGMNVKPERLDWTDTVYWDVEAAAVPSEFVLEVGDLVFGMDRPFVGSGVRVAAISGNDLPALLLQRVLRIRPNDKAGRGYMRYVMSSDAFLNYLEPLFTGVSVPHVSEWQVRKFKMPFPPLDEQKNIADYLDRETARIDTLIEEQQRLIEMLHERRQAVALHAIHEPMPASAATDKLGRSAHIGNGSTPRRESTAYWDGGETPWLNSSVVNEPRVTRAQQFVTALALRECHLPVVAPGSVLVGLTGQGKTRGTATILDIEATVNQHVAYVTPDRNRWLPEYLLWSLRASYDELRRLSEENGSTKGGLTCEALKQFRLAAPPLDEQRRIAANLDEQTAKIDNLIVETAQFIELSKDRRAALIAAAVTGQIDVREMA